jgi:vitamin B12 transporter
VTLLDPRDTGANYGELLPRRAQYTARLDLDRDIGDLSVGATLFESGPSFEDPANTQRLGGYGTLDVRAAWRLQSRWELQALLKNALNRDYETALYYNQPGRSAYLTLRYVPPLP